MFSNFEIAAHKFKSHYELVTYINNESNSDSEHFFKDDVFLDWILGELEELKRSPKDFEDNYFLYEIQKGLVGEPYSISNCYLIRLPSWED